MVGVQNLYVPVHIGYKYMLPLHESSSQPLIVQILQGLTAAHAQTIFPHHCTKKFNRQTLFLQV
jgi:hypothetical protein